MNGTAGFRNMGRWSILRKQELSYRPSSLIALWAVDFSHQGHKALCHLAFSLADFLKKESTANTPATWGTVTTKINRMLPALAYKLFK
jgi:hypothetical protein